MDIFQGQGFSSGSADRPVVLIDVQSQIVVRQKPRPNYRPPPIPRTQILLLGFGPLPATKVKDLTKGVVLWTQRVGATGAPRLATPGTMLRGALAGLYDIYHVRDMATQLVQNHERREIVDKFRE